MNEVIKALSKLEQMDNNMTVAEAYTAYHKITGERTIDVHFDGDNYGIAIDNVYSQPVGSPYEITKQAHKEIANAHMFLRSVKQNKHDNLSADALLDFCQQYYFWMKYPESDATHNGPDEFRHMSKHTKIIKGYKLMLKDAHDIISRVTDAQKHGNGYYLRLVNPCLITCYQIPVTLADMCLTISDALSRALYRNIQKSKPNMLTAREAKAVFDTKFQRDSIKMNWAGNWKQIGSPNTYSDMGLTKQRCNSVNNALAITDYAMNNHASIPACDINKDKIFKYNIKDAKKHSCMVANA